MSGSMDKTKTICILGKRGMGKTTLSKSLILQHEEKGALVFIFDFVGEYSGDVFSDRRDIKIDSRRPFLYRGSDDRYFTDTVWQAGKIGKPVLCVLDEVDIFGKNSFPIAYLYRYGRHRNISIIAVARRFYDMPMYIRDLSAELKVFRLTGMRDLDALAKAKNKPTDDIIRTLPPHHFVSINL